MSELSHESRERCRQLMMAEVDGEISKADRVELDDLLNRHPELRNELDEFLRLKEVTETMKLKEPNQDVWQNYWINVYNRLERGIAWLVLAIGAGILVAFGIYSLVRDVWLAGDIPILVKIGIFGLILGFVLLLISIGREKIFLWRHERYKEIQR